LPDGIFQTQNPNLGKFWENLAIEDVCIFTAIWYILRPNGLFYGYLVNFVVIWYFFPCFGCSKKNLATLALTDSPFANNI
jgi:hypothetical protein